MFPLLHERFDLSRAEIDSRLAVVRSSPKPPRSIMNALFRMVLLAPICGCGLAYTRGQTTTVIPGNLAASHIDQYATVEGVVAKVFSSKNGNTFLNIGAAYPNQTFTGWIPKDSQVADDPDLSVMEGRKVRITGTINLYRGKPEIKIMSRHQLVLE
jgi:hypothetical protein